MRDDDSRRKKSMLTAREYLFSLERFPARMMSCPKDSDIVICIHTLLDLAQLFGRVTSSVNNQTYTTTIIFFLTLFPMRQKSVGNRGEGKGSKKLRQMRTLL